MGTGPVGGTDAGEMAPQGDSDNLPWCDPALFEKPIDFGKIPPPPNIKTGEAIVASCKLKALGKHLNPKDVIMSPMIRPVNQSTANYSWSAIQSYCGNSCNANSPGITALTANISTNQPTLRNGASWSNNHYGNRVHIGNPNAGTPLLCPATFSNFSFGYAQGAGGTYNFNNWIFYELFGLNYDTGNWVCATYDSGIRTSGPGNLTFNAYSDSTGRWRAFIWTGSWVQIVSWKPGYVYAPYLDIGHELYSANSFSDMIVPINMINKIDIVGTGTAGGWVPLNTDALNRVGSPLANTLNASANSPWIVMDSNGIDYTSIAAFTP